MISITASRKKWNTQAYGISASIMISQVTLLLQKLLRGGALVYGDLTTDTTHVHMHKFKRVSADSFRLYYLITFAKVVDPTGSVEPVYAPF